MRVTSASLRGSARATALAAIRELQLDELASLAGGLVLLPCNLHHLARLESLAMCAVAGISRGRQTISHTFARKLLNESMATWLGHDDEPCETLATESFTYNGGTHILVAPHPETLFALRILSEVIASVVSPI